MPTQKNRQTPARKSSEIRPTVEPGGPDSFDERGVAEPKRRVAGARAHGTINVADQNFGESDGPDTFDGRERMRKGTSGREPGGRFSKAYYETPAAIISRDHIRKPGGND